MQKRRRPRYNREFKERAVQLTAKKTVKEVAEELGIAATSLVRWRAELGQSPTRKTKGSLTSREMQQRLLELERENEMLRKEKKVAEMEREILKKAAAFFAEEQL